MCSTHYNHCTVDSFVDLFACGIDTAGNIPPDQVTSFLETFQLWQVFYCLVSSDWFLFQFDTLEGIIGVTS